MADEQSTSRLAPADYMTLLRDRSLHLLAAVNAIPSVGGFLGTYLSEIRAVRQAERVEQLFRSLAERLAAVNPQDIRTDYVTSDQFAETCLRAAQEAARSSNQQRIQLLAQVLGNAAASRKVDYEYADTVVDLCGGLAPHHIALLSVLNEYDVKAAIYDFSGDIDVVQPTTPLPPQVVGRQNEPEDSLHLLQAKGLVWLDLKPLPTLLPGMQGQFQEHWDREWMEVFSWQPSVTSLGRRLLEFLAAERDRPTGN